VFTQERKADLERRWQEAVTPLPGSVPYENRRPFRIRQREEGLSLLEIFLSRFPKGVREEYWLEVFDKGDLRDLENRVVSDPHLKPQAGVQFVRLMRDWVEPEVATDLKVVWEDEALLVIDKPAPLGMHEGGRFYKNTLSWMMAKAWPELDARYGHRLDSETSGVLLCTKCEEARRRLQRSFEAREVEKEYCAIVHGSPSWEQKLIENEVPTGGREDGALQSAQTEVKVLERRDDGTSVLSCRPLTGRTHQIRVHLWQEGLPIQGDGWYLPGGIRGEGLVFKLGESGLRLRSWKVGLKHPFSGEVVDFEVNRTN